MPDNLPEHHGSQERASGQMPQREQVLGDLRAEFQRLLLSDFALNHLKLFKQAVPPMYEFLRREARRKTRSPQFQMILDVLCHPDSPVDIKKLEDFKTFLSALNAQLGVAVSTATEKSLFKLLLHLSKERKKPSYWDEYLDFLRGKSVSTIIRERNPGYDQLDSVVRGQHFKKVYNAIQRLVKKHGGPPFPPAQIPVG